MNCIDKGTWKLRKLTFCGDYPDSALQEEDEGEEEVCGIGCSVQTQGEEDVDGRNSLTVVDASEIVTEEFHQDTTAASIQNSDEKEKEKAAAIAIQSAFRGFLVLPQTFQIHFCFKYQHFK